MAITELIHLYDTPSLYACDEIVRVGALIVGLFQNFNDMWIALATNPHRTTHMAGVADTRDAAIAKAVEAVHGWNAYCDKWSVDKKFQIDAPPPVDQDAPAADDQDVPAADDQDVPVDQDVPINRVALSSMSLAMLFDYVLSLRDGGGLWNL